MERRVETRGGKTGSGVRTGLWRRREGSRDEGEDGRGWKGRRAEGEGGEKTREVLGCLCSLYRGEHTVVWSGSPKRRRKAGLALAMEEGRSLIEEVTTSFGAAVERGLGNGRRGRAEEEEETSPTDDDSPRRGKLLLGVANVGGSLTVLLQIALFAWGVRRLRSMLDNRRRRIQEQADAERAAGAMPSSSSSRPVDQVPFAMLSPVAVKRLVEFDPVQYVFVDVRDAAAVKDSPSPFDAVLNIPEMELSGTLQLSDAAWEARFPARRKIGRTELIIFVSTNGHEAERAASIAADLGYSGSCVLSGGIEAYAAAMSTYVDVPLKSLSRDAVATLLGKHENSEESGSSSIHLLDVRRLDERESFGSIGGSKNIPVVELPKALTLDEVAWKESYHFPKFSEDDTVIFQCRVNGRASWAAQLAQDAGLKQCFVYKDGTQGWRLDPTVQRYDAYKLGNTPSDPIEFEVEEVDHEAARKELQQQGLG